MHVVTSPTGAVPLSSACVRDFIRLEQEAVRFAGVEPGEKVQTTTAAVEV